MNAIRWMASRGDLLVGTAAGEGVIDSSSTSKPLTPTTTRHRRQTRDGGAELAPIEAGDAVLFLQKQGRKLQEAVYAQSETTGISTFTTTDMTRRNAQISLGGIVDMAYQKEPFSIIWCVRDDGQLLGFTYVREEKVLAWHRHLLGGSVSGGDAWAVVESVMTIPGAGDNDELWMIVKRTINGVTKRFIEILEDFFPDDAAQADAFFVDAGLTYSGAATDTITGLDHLEGETVQVFADGGDHPDVVVASGSVTLERQVTKAQIGLGLHGHAGAAAPGCGRPIWHGARPGQAHRPGRCQSLPDLGRQGRPGCRQPGRNHHAGQW